MAYTRVLITGKNGYIGKKCATWFCGRSFFEVEYLDMRSDRWKSFDMSSFDAVINAAGIVHINCDDADLYNRVNTTLAIECAQRAKESGVKQFVQLSTLSVYTPKRGIGVENEITGDTKENPETLYGISKLNADRELVKLNEEDFKVAIVRTPMVYGADCKGNYARLSKIAQKLPIFPKIDNKRSMIYIYTLTEFLMQLIKNKDSGIFYPQNPEYVSTSEMVRLIRKAKGKKTCLTKAFNPLLKLMSKGNGRISALISKLFGNLTVSMELSKYGKDYYTVDFEKSINESERTSE